MNTVPKALFALSIVPFVSSRAFSRLAALKASFSALVNRCRPLWMPLLYVVYLFGLRLLDFVACRDMQGISALAPQVRHSSYQDQYCLIFSCSSGEKNMTSLAWALLGGARSGRSVSPRRGYVEDGSPRVFPPVPRLRQALGCSLQGSGE